MTSKYEKLVEYLGNLEEYIFTGWMFPKPMSSTYSVSSPAWKCVWERQVTFIDSFKDRDLPELMSECHCTTPIKWNYLIKHISTGRFCKLHKEYHSDNAIHLSALEETLLKQSSIIPDYKTDDSDDDFDDFPLTSEEEEFVRSAEEQIRLEEIYSRPFQYRPLNFGKYKGVDPMSLLGEDIHYIRWLFGSNMILSSDKQELKELLMATPIHFGKFEGQTFNQLKANNPGYYYWVKRTIEQPYVRYW
ncbi:unnamed protein product [Phytophthora lilii]|uniref:Unnamed protein product n=1 Tax=Phytophthora lilii TaxID=2077276 RepID=A0A9W6XEN1_9STRA|nr:unnamed protein product [Phytophthora lilii]